MTENKLLDLVAEDRDLQSFELGKPLKADSLESLALNVAAAFRDREQNIAVILPSLFDAHTFIDFISQFVSSDSILFFPYDEVLRIEAISSSKEMAEERLFTMSEIAAESQKHIFIANSIALLHEVSPLERFKKAVKTIKVKDIFPPKELASLLTDLGYARVGKVESVFEYSWRGEIFDIFAPSNPDPYRLEYFDDVIDDIRVFSSKDELSFSRANSVKIAPAHENIFNSTELQKGIEKIKNELERETKGDNVGSDELAARTDSFIDEALTSGIDENRARYLPYFLSEHTSILSYLTNYRVLFYRPEDIESVANSYYMDAVDYFEEIRKARLALAGEMSCFKLESVLEQCREEGVEDERNGLSVTDIPYHFVSLMEAPAHAEEIP
jgi:transcription-repair coupling factor (superfamily II helicase)